MKTIKNIYGTFVLRSDDEGICTCIHHENSSMTNGKAKQYQVHAESIRMLDRSSRLIFYAIDKTGTYSFRIATSILDLERALRDKGHLFDHYEVVDLCSLIYTDKDEYHDQWSTLWELLNELKTLNEQLYRANRIKSTLPKHIHETLSQCDPVQVKRDKVYSVILDLPRVKEYLKNRNLDVQGCTFRPIPPILRQSQTMMGYLEKGKEEGLLDEHYMWIENNGNTRAQMAEFARQMSVALNGAERTDWKLFEDWWGIRNLRMYAHAACDKSKMAKVERIFRSPKRIIRASEL